MTRITYFAVYGKRVGAWCAAAAVLVWLVGCVGVGRQAADGQWQCDPTIDAAVENGDWAGARADHEALLVREPGNCLAMYHLGYIWGQLDDRQAEIRYYLKAIDCGDNRDDKLFFNLGMAYLETGATADALAAFEQAVTVGPRNAENYFGLGLAKVRAGATDQAESSFKKALALDPRHWDAHLALARIYLDQSRWEEARVHLDAVDRGDSGNDYCRELRRLLEARMASEYKR